MRRRESLIALTVHFNIFLDFIFAEKTIFQVDLWHANTLVGPN
jgi:hypothetical protein